MNMIWSTSFHRVALIISRENKRLPWKIIYEFAGDYEQDLKYEFPSCSSHNFTPEKAKYWSIINQTIIIWWTKAE